MTDELTNRLQRSTSEVALTDEVKAAHLGAISEALENAPVVPLSPVSRRRRVIAAVTAAALIGPTGLAAASGDALPGEALYGVKQVSEQVTSLFDPEVVARHRIEEAEALAMLGRRSDDVITRAVDAVGDLPEDHALRQRLAALADRDDDDSDRDPGPMVEPDSDDDDEGNDTAADDDPSDDVDDDMPHSTVTDEIDDEAGDDEVTDDQADDSDDFDDDSDDGDDSDSADDTEDD